MQRQIISHHVGRYVHRLGVEAALDRFLKVHRRGYFILTGGPGFGKTAVACHLIAQRRLIHHLIKRLEGRAEPRLILGSLLRQLADRSNRSVEFMVDLPALTETFETMLAVVALQERPVLVVIDGLDELPDDMTSDVPFLPGDALPDGVFMVLTCRRGLRLDRLQEDLTEVPWILHELGPLSSSEVDQLVKRQGQSLAAADLGLIAEASHGNPLYLHALIDELTSNPAFDLHQLPPVVEGYFRRAVKRISDQEVATGAIAVLAASRTPLTEIDLSTITGLTRAQIREQVIRPIRAFLAESEAGYAFYHHSFAEFVRNEVVDGPSLRSAHAAIAAWLLAPERRDSESCWRSLAYHLFESGDAQSFHQTIDEAFLSEKVRRCGYAVLEDVELLTQSMIREGDLRLVERGVAIVESLRRVAGGDLMTDVERTVQFAQAVSRPDRVGLSKQVTTADVDVFVRMVPRIGVSADFAEVVTDENGIWAVIGDVPASGLKSAFVARFVANLFRQIVQKAPNARARELIAEIGRRIEPFGNVARMSMQCVRIDVPSGMMHIANAGHPFPARVEPRVDR